MQLFFINFKVLRFLRNVLSTEPNLSQSRAFKLHLSQLRAAELSHARPGSTKFAPSPSGAVELLRPNLKPPSFLSSLNPAAASEQLGLHHVPQPGTDELPPSRLEPPSPLHLSHDPSASFPTSLKRAPSILWILKPRLM